MAQENKVPAQPSTPPVAQPATQAPVSVPASSHMMWIAAAGVAVIAVILGGTFFVYTQTEQAPGAPTSTEKLVRLGLSMDEVDELRWQTDRDYMIAHAKEAGASLEVLVANKDDTTQIAQIRNFIAQKVDAIIVIAHDTEALSGVVDEAHKANIKIIGYDRLMLNSDLDLYISFDSTKVGKYAAEYVLKAVPSSVSTPIRVAYVGGAETDFNAVLVRDGAMSVLDPLVKDGKVKIVYDASTKNWNPDEAYKNIKAFFDKGGAVDAIVSANDGMAGGIVQALKERKLDGKIPVSGQDAELPALQRIVSGTQTVTSYKPLKQLARVAVDDAILLAKGQAPTTNGSINNKKKDVPAYLIDPIPVTKDNIQETVIKDGFHTEAEIYGASSGE